MASKVKIAICSQDREYRERFVKCFLRHYKSMYDLYMFETIEQIEQDKENVYEVVLVDNTSQRELLTAKEMQVIVLYETEEKLEETENLVYEQKYQEIYKIENAIQRVLPCTDSFVKNKKGGRIIGVFSLGCENQQLPFSALLATECAPKAKTLVLNLQQYSRLEMLERATGFHLEDLVLSVEMENCSRGRIEGAIVHEENWDYVYSVRNTECLAEISDKTYRQVIELLIQEWGYQNIIINFGAVFIGVHSLMSSCDEFYFLTNKNEFEENREEVYLRELAQKGYEKFAAKIRRIELPRNNSGSQNWKQLVQQWRRSVLGDSVRMHLWGE